MKQIFFKKMSDPQKRIKEVCINSEVEDKECKTKTQKGFVYRASKADKGDLTFESPEVNIQKSFDTNKNIEKFSLKVKGTFYITHQLEVLEVNFQHTLDIEIFWKTKVFSPKKSVTSLQ